MFVDKVISFREKMLRIGTRPDQCPRWLLQGMCIFEFLIVLSTANPQIPVPKSLAQFCIFQTPEPIPCLFPTLLLIIGTISRLFFNLSILKIIYPIIVIHPSPLWLTSILSIFLVILFVFELLSTTCYGFYYSSPHNQRNNYMKIVHYIFFTVLLLYHSENSNIIGGSITFILFLARCFYPLFDTRIQVLQQILYLTLGVAVVLRGWDYWWMMVGLGGAMGVVWVRWVVKKRFCGLQGKMEQGKIDGRVIEILRYLFWGVYTEEGNRRIRKFLDINQLVLELPQECLQINIDNRATILRCLTQYIKQNSSNSFHDQLLKAQVQLTITQNIFHTNTTLLFLQSTTSNWNFIHCLLIRRLRSDLITNIHKQSTPSSHKTFSEFSANHKLTQLMVESAKLYELLWQPISSPDISFSSLDKLLYKTQQSLYQISQLYSSLPYRSKQTILTYYFYSLYVERDTSKSLTILSQYCDFQTSTVNDLACENSVAFAVSMESQQLGVITHLGQNAQAVLGYRRQQLMGLSFEELVPGFMKNWHREYVEGLMRGEKTKTGGVLYGFRKNSICENSWGCWMEFGVFLKVMVCEGRVIMAGFLNTLYKTSNRSWVVFDEYDNIVAKSPPEKIFMSVPQQLNHQQQHDTLKIDGEQYELFKTANTPQGRLFIYATLCPPQLQSKPLSTDLMQCPNNKFILQKDSTLDHFFSSKSQLSLTQPYTLHFLLICLSLFMASLMAGLNRLKNNDRTEAKLQHCNMSRLLMIKQTNLVWTMSWMHQFSASRKFSIPLQFNLTTVSSTIKKLHDNMETALTFDFSERFTLVAAGRKYETSSFQVLESMRTYLGFLIQNIQQGLDHNIDWVLNYLKANQYELVRNVMFNLKGYRLRYLMKRLSQYTNAWYSYQILYSVFVAITIGVIFFMERQARVLDFRATLAICGIGAKDRRDFVETIQLFLEKVQRNLGFKDSGRRSFMESQRLTFKDASSRDSSVLLSPSLMSPNQSMTNRLLQFGVKSQKTLGKESQEAPLQIQLKLRSVNIFLVFVCLLCFSFSVTLSTRNLQTSFDKRFSSYKFVDNLLVLQNRTTTFLQKIQFFFRTIQTPSDYPLLKSITPSNLRLFSINLLDTGDYQHFHQLYSKMSKSSFCEFADCVTHGSCNNATPLLRSTDDVMNYYSSLMEQMGLEVWQGEVAQREVMGMKVVEEVVCVAGLFMRKMNEMGEKYFDGIYQMLEKSHYAMEAIILEELMMAGGMLVFMALPFWVGLRVRRRRALRALDLVDARSYSKAEVIRC